MFRAMTMIAIALAVAGCSAARPPQASPTSSTPVATPSPAPTATREPTLAPTPAASQAAAEGPITLRPVEPWLLYRWYPGVLYVIRPDGSDRQELRLGATLGTGEPYQAAWSPDGERIGFIVRDESKTPRDSIWTANADGTNAAPFYDGDGACDDGADHPVWSTDGKRMALICYYIVGGKGITTVAVLDLATMQKTELVRLAGPEFIDNPPTWSPDGKIIAFDILTWDPTDTFVTSMLVATVPSTGGKVTRLTDPAMFGSHPDWSPDGTLLAFNTYDTSSVHQTSNPSNLYTIKPDGTDLRQLSTASTDGKMRIGQPSWSVDGTRIWVSVARDFEKDASGWPKYTQGWVDATTGELHEIGTPGKVFVERPGG